MAEWAMPEPIAVPLADGAVAIRPCATADSISALSQLLNRTYAGLAALGFRYVATWQGDDITRRRIAGGCCLLAEREGRLVGTITAHPAHAAGGCPWYERPDVATFSQFGVEPALQHAGIGSALLGVIEAWAPTTGAAELACDTASGATHLVAWYQQRGYRIVATQDWPDTNYESVVLSRRGSRQ